MEGDRLSVSQIRRKRQEELLGATSVALRAAE